MVYDSTDGYVLLFGGYLTTVSPRHFYNDTWTFVHGKWTNITTATRPSARFGFMLADDPADHVVVLFGGQGSKGGASFLNDTWEFDAGVWTNVTSGVAPPGRFWGSMSYDSETSQVLLFGGNEGGGPSTEYTNNTWAFHAGTWTQLAPATLPPGRDDQAQVDDVAAHEVVMFGGLGAVDYLNDTWAYSSGTWSPIATATGVDARAGAGMVYDAAVGGIVMYGGYPASTYYYDTWVFQVGVWTGYDLSPTPPAGTIWGQMAYDAADQYVVQFQGDGAYNSTWSFNFSGSPSSPLSVSVHATPLSGFAPLTVTFTSLASGGTRPYTYFWTLGDGATSAMENLTHTYSTSGTYPVVVVANDSVGGSVKGYANITVTAMLTPPPSNSTSSSSNYWTLWIILAIVVVAIAIIIVLVLRRRSRPPSPQGGPGPQGPPNPPS
jgi:PKD repeat protein